jgi:HSP20 family protein
MAQYRLYRTSLAPWAGFDDLRREMDAVFGRFAGGFPEVRTGVFPAVNLYETEDAYVLTAELPGVDPKEIEVSLEGATVNLRGERKIDHSRESGSAHRMERQAGAFRRAFELPATVDAAKVEAIHRSGVLMLKLPKQPERQPRRIAIQVA